MNKIYALVLGITLLFIADAQADGDFDFQDALPITGIIKRELLDLEAFHERHPEALPREGLMEINFEPSCNFGQGC